MNLDQSSIQRLLSLNDTQLRLVLKKLAAENGIDLSGFSLGAAELAHLRSLLGMATPQQIQQLLNQFSGKGRGPSEPS